ncbi:hypothetical protein AVHY2522_13685 [Acidovorax sp. SUPP2522]|uniref:hypothetical protein n=1 Tax=unclassified Acidovorax TaxID=2684926 RepID=UPI00234BB6FD|nr:MULTISPECIES: hypothetical protein [unclassified Acidovorax]WCM96259.1 hypothetical protein M5C96_17710 [Acidovorax sp. GBBC 1281]GKT16996.1 hypothetical protein AVHY2522_13685 [Acidovorax sp. SUPP2522]
MSSALPAPEPTAEHDLWEDVDFSTIPLPTALRIQRAMMADSVAAAEANLQMLQAAARLFDLRFGFNGKAV